VTFAVTSTSFLRVDFAVIFSTTRFSGGARAPSAATDG
jgi:hypothetical protein